MANQLDGWNEDETVMFYSNNRIEYDDLYESEKYFLNNNFLFDIETILDVGCSVGGMYNIFRKLNKNIKYTGVDVANKAIMQAKKKFFTTSAEFILYDGGVFPLDNRYDLVFSSGVMHLIDNYKYIFKQMISKAKKCLLVDFRITSNDSYVGKFNFLFSSKGEGKNYTVYHVLNFHELMSFFESFSKISRVHVYGYQGTPSDMSEGISEVYMIFFKIVLDDVPHDGLDVVFDNKELEEVFLSDK